MYGSDIKLDQCLKITKEEWQCQKKKKKIHCDIIYSGYNL